MTEFVVELHQVRKVFAGGGKKQTAVVAVDHVDLRIQAGEFFTLLGPSGCGKTTLLRLIAGFEAPTVGRIIIQGQPSQHIPAYRRPVNTVFQNYALFPHLSVAQNVGFGLTVKRIPPTERDKRVREALDLVRLTHLAGRKPAQLSGGQQQRVALARAIINRPAVLLLDEPLGALDLKLRKTMQLELKHLQNHLGMTFIYVTHDQEEALAMSDRIAVMDQGRILQVADPITIYEKPATRFVADFIGESNFLQGVVRGIDSGHIQVHLSSGNHLAAPLNGHQLSPGQAITLAIRPEKLALQTTNGTPPANTLKGIIREVVYLGTDTRYTVELPSQEAMVVRMQNVHGRQAQQFTPGQQVKIDWLAEDMHVLDQ